MAGPGQGARWWVKDRVMNRQTMQNEVEYLLSGLWRGRRKGGRAERDAERERLRLEADQLEEGVACLLKVQGRSLQFSYLISFALFHQHIMKSSLILNKTLAESLINFELYICIYL